MNRPSNFLLPNRFAYVACLLAVLGYCFAAPVFAGEPAPVEHSSHRFFGGTFLEYNSAWEPGVLVSYANARIWDGRPRLQLAYATTRLATAFGSRTLDEDRLRLLAGWYFREGQRVKPAVGLGFGYTHFDHEENAFALLDTNAFGAHLQTNLEVAILGGLSAYGGLAVEFLASPTVYPLALSLGIQYDISEVLP